MVFDLNEMLSHPDKKLEVHVLGVRDKAIKRFDSPLVNWAALFHDLGKINPNFQKKINPNYRGEKLGYDQHAYLSAWAWLCFLEKNIRHAQFKADFGGDFLKWKIVFALIAKHHGNLPNFDCIFKDEPLTKLKTFIKTNADLPLSAFLDKKLAMPHEAFRLIENEGFKKIILFPEQQVAKWRENALQYFLETQFGFAALIEGDKRDAGDKYIREYWHLESSVEQNTAELAKNLSQKWLDLAAKTNKSELDECRTAIREEAVLNLKTHLNNENRVFTLTAPTGAGKTFSLLALAAEIQKSRPNEGLSILYALPFLSIIEQVEDIVHGLFPENFDVLTASSKSKNEKMEALIEKLDHDPQAEDFKDLLQMDFITQTFDHPFIVTTFVQFFETLMSNRNSTLLKLPNFSKRIFLIDEIQALPPRLYIFFAAWLDAFCRRWDSYAILSTATMPKIDFPIKSFVDEVKKPELLFKNYLSNLPKELLDAEKFFKMPPFNRYQVHLTKPFEMSLEQLATDILEKETACLVILNTIGDSKALFIELKNRGVKASLLNTHFIPADRKKKIKEAKAALAAGERFVLVSTQLIEAGVDVDFPVVFRDLCPLPSLIQSAGRCNRNKRLAGLGEVYFFHLKKENGKSGAASVYRESDTRQFLDFSQKHIPDGVEEKDLLAVQSQFFRFIADNLEIGKYKILTEKDNLIELVNAAKFDDLGKFKLINEKDFGSEFQYFIRKNYADRTYDEAVELLKKLLDARDFQEKRRMKILLAEKLKLVAERMVTIRVIDKDNVPLFANEKEQFDIRVLSDLRLYDFENGFQFDTSENAII